MPTLLHEPSKLEEAEFNFDLENSPLILTAPVFIKEFFTGHLFPRLHLDKMYNFYESVNTPLDVLRDENRRRGLIEVLRSFKNERTFWSMNGELDEISSEILNQGNLYSNFSMKVGKKERNFNVPQSSFKYLLTEYVLPFVKKQKKHPSSHGGEKGWSVEKSLKAHLPVRSALSFDMESAFDQCEINHVFDFFYDNLREFDIQQRTDAAGFLASLCTVRSASYEDSNYDATLPQGSPVSMSLFNRIMYPIDEALERFSRKGGLRYSRWVDDFVISSQKRRAFDKFASALRLAQEHFSIAPQKVFFFHQGPAYLLGHRLNFNEIKKMDKKEFNEKRGPLEEIYLAATHPSGHYIYDIFSTLDYDENSLDEEIPF